MKEIQIKKIILKRNVDKVKYVMKNRREYISQIKKKQKKTWIPKIF